MDFKYWKYDLVELDGQTYCHIFCEAMNKDQPLGVVKEGYKEFKAFEQYLRKEYPTWVAWTKLQNAHIMRMLRKVGAKPFEIDLKQDIIWFYKHF